MTDQSSIRGNKAAPLRILTVANVPPDPNSGAAGTVYHTNVALRELGHDVDEIWADQLGPRRIRHGNLHSLLEQPRAYRKAVMSRIVSTTYDVIQISQPQGYLAAKALRKSGFRGVVVNRSHGVELRVNEVLPQWRERYGIPESRFPVVSGHLQRLLERQWAGVARWCDSVVVGCSLDADCLNRRTACGSVHVIPHGVHDVFYEYPAALKFDRIRLLHVGQYAFFKGCLVLIDTLNALLPKHPDVSFTWVCAETHHREIRTQISPEIRNRIQLLRAMPQSDLIRVMDRHNIFLFPSLFEGFGKAPFEAMARGLCVVASSEGGMRDLIVDGVNGLLCPRGDVNSFVSRLEKLIANPEGAASIGQTGVETVEGLRWRHCADRYESLYEQLKVKRHVV